MEFDLPSPLPLEGLVRHGLGRAVELQSVIWAKKSNVISTEGRNLAKRKVYLLKAFMAGVRFLPLLQYGRNDIQLFLRVLRAFVVKTVREC